MDKTADLKAKQRRQLLSIRHGMEETVVREKSLKIERHLLNSEYYEKARVIFCYVSFENEVQTHRILETALAAGKTVGIPYIDAQRQMHCVQVDSLLSLQKDTYGILAPQDGVRKIAKEDLDLILVPGVGFDSTGMRLGFGKGYYDRFLEGVFALKIGLCYQSQLVSAIVHDAHDAQMDYLLTEAGWI